MDHILLLAAIALFVLILGVIWKWLRKLQRRSRIRRGNNYLYQEYNYEPDIDYRAVDVAWDNNQDNGIKSREINNELDWEINLDDIEEPETNKKNIPLTVTEDINSTEEAISNDTDSWDNPDSSESPDDD